MEGEGTEPTQELTGREALTPVFDDLNRYEATTHFNGQSTIELDGDRAMGESYCLAHHLSVDEDGRRVVCQGTAHLVQRPNVGGRWVAIGRRMAARRPGSGAAAVPRRRTARAAPGRDP